MISFLFKGLLRDRSRSRFPVIIVVVGVTLTVFISAWLNGVMSDLTRTTASFETGHVKIMSRAYAKEADQVPNDLAFQGVAGLLAELRRDYPDMVWAPRIRFGGLLDVPDSLGETRAQGPVAGLAVGLLGPRVNMGEHGVNSCSSVVSKSGPSPEIELLNLKTALVQGRLPARAGEVLISDDLARRLNLKPGDVATLFTSDVFGSMATRNFTIAGTVRFGVGAMDRGALLADIADIQQVLDMDDAAGEVLGFFGDYNYDARRAEAVVADFNRRHSSGQTETTDEHGLTPNSPASTHSSSQDDFAPEMVSLRNQGGMGQIFDLMGSAMGLIIGVFVLAMAIVLWNAGLMGSLRRYGEIGLRLAIGENRGHLYWSLLVEAVLIGLMGSVIGTAIGLGVSYWFQAVGLNISSMIRGATMMMPGVMRARITPECVYVGFLPGLLATILGTAIAGLGIYRRETAKLMKEMEA